MSGVLKGDSMDSLDVSALMLSDEEDDIKKMVKEKKSREEINFRYFWMENFSNIFSKEVIWNKKNAVAECIKCIPNKIEIKGSLAVSSNFITHLKRIHTPNDVKEYTDYIFTNKRRKVVSHKTGRQSSYIKVTQLLI